MSTFSLCFFKTRCILHVDTPYEEVFMPKGKDKGKAEEKKKPLLSLKEKREKKREKKSSKGE